MFFAFWLSHVPPSRLPAFWDRVAAMLAPGARAVFVDDGPGAVAIEDGVETGPIPTVERSVDDGGRYRIVKVFHDARTLTTDLASLGWTARVRDMDTRYVGFAERSLPSEQ